MTLLSRRSGLTVAILLAILSHTEIPLSACSCYPIGTPCFSTSNVSHVFVGEVVELTPAGPGSGIEPFGGRGLATFVRVRFKLIEAFRGDLFPGFVDVFTDVYESMCGYRFSRSVGKYLVYAHSAPTNGVLTTGICTRTQPFSAAGEDLKYLRAEREPGVTASTLRGQAMRANNTAGVRAQTPFSGGVVRLVSSDDPARSFETRTTADGSYSISVPPGKYVVTLETPIGLYALPETAAVHLINARGCHDVRFTVLPDGRVGGRIIGADGQPVPFLVANIVSTRAAAGNAFGPHQSALTDASGRFEFKRLPEGDYFVGLETRREAGKPAADIPWFLNRDTKNPETIRVERESPVSIGDFTLPPTLEIASITGRFVDAKGSSIAGAHVGLGSCCWPEAAVQTAADGTFSISALAGRQYTLFAMISAGGLARNTESAPFVAVKGTSTFELRLK